MYYDIQWYTVESRVPGGRVYSGFQVTGMIEWGTKSKPSKIPRASIKTPKNPMPNSRAIKFLESVKWYNTKNRNISFECPKKSLLKASYPKNTCQNFPTPKNPEIENFKPPKKPSIIPVAWNPEYHGPWVPCFVLLFGLNYREVWKIGDKIKGFDFLGDRNQVWFEL